jgi:hypothetical protein
MAVVLLPEPVVEPEVSVEDRLRAVCGHLNAMGERLHKRDSSSPTPRALAHYVRPDE